MPFRDESLDAVLSIAVVHHFATTERRVCALRELARVTRIGGRLMISVWAMEQSQRKFESQDVLVPWHRPKNLSTPSLELTSTSEEDAYPVYQPYNQNSDSDSRSPNRSKNSSKRKGRTKHKSIDPIMKKASPSSSSLSSPNETCYSFVRRAIQKLAGGKRMGVHRPWFLDGWTTCAKEPPPKRYDPDGCECCECENVQDLPIELRRVDDEDVPSQNRRQTFPSSQIINDIYSSLKSKSMTNFKMIENNNIIRSYSGSVSIADSLNNDNSSNESKPQSTTNTLTKPKLVKQKQSICDEDEEEEALDEPTDMKSLLPNVTDYRLLSGTRRGNVFKQRSLNEELMSADRLKEKEKLRRNIQKQASLNENLIYQRHHAFDTFKDTLFSVSTAKRFQLIKTGFTNKIKNSTTNIERVTGSSLKNGFVRIFQNWKSSDLMSPTISEDDVSESKKLVSSAEEKKEQTNPLTSTTVPTGERRHSKEDGSDSSKDSSLQSDTSVDSEDSFASVIFVPKSDPMSPTLSPGPTSPRINTSVPNSPRIKQSSCPTSPRIKQMPLSVYPLTKQLSSPKPTTKLSDSPSPTEKLEKEQRPLKKCAETLAKKYAVQQIPKFKRTNLNSGDEKKNNAGEEKIEMLKKIKELLNQKPGFGVRTSRGNYPIVRHSSVSNGRVESIVKPLPKLLSLELFNPETDDKDSDSSGVSSPDSVDSVISVEMAEISSKVNSLINFFFPDNFFI